MKNVSIIINLTCATVADALTAIKQLEENGYGVAIATSQPGIPSVPTRATTPGDKGPNETAYLAKRGAKFIKVNSACFDEVKAVEFPEFDGTDAEWREVLCEWLSSKGLDTNAAMTAFALDRRLPNGSKLGMEVPAEAEEKLPDDFEPY